MPSYACSSAVRPLRCGTAPSRPPKRSRSSSNSPKRSTARHSGATSSATGTVRSVGCDSAGTVDGVACRVIRAEQCRRHSRGGVVPHGGDHPEDVGGRYPLRRAGVTFQALSKGVSELCPRSACIACERRARHANASVEWQCCCPRGTPLPTDCPQDATNSGEHWQKFDVQCSDGSAHRRTRHLSNRKGFRQSERDDRRTRRPLSTRSRWS